MADKVMIIGLDCAPPELVFERWREDLPNLRKLMEAGIYGKLESTVPPITVPAWTSMVTGKSPGRLGIYGMRNRQDHSYDRLIFANSLMVKEDTLWDVLGRKGKKVILIGIPQTYPPKPVNGCMVTCFLTPDTRSSYTYPESLRREIESWVGDYLLDVDNYRTDAKEDLIRQLYEMTERRFEVARHLLSERQWDFFMMVEIGVDRIHHAFWKYSDPRHDKYEPGSKYEAVIHDYYVYIDGKVGQLLDLIGEETAVIVVSDHGAKAMKGGVCVNEWLIDKGYLHLKERPAGIIPFAKARIDWKRTMAWGEGGYYSRIFLNVKGREPEGIIDAADYERVRDELKAGLEAICDERGVNLQTKIYKPEEVYREIRGVPPDLIVYFGDLSWRSVGSVGMGTILTDENDTGPDDANHDRYGIFVMRSPGLRSKGERKGLNILDIAPTVLSLFDIPPSEDLGGRVIE
ncbi:MAG: phosphodiesterase [Deltaproteobacteria bacterium]|nr:MAG: phosphodiesterase [Deltaproteobacteria bacterium]